MSDGVTNETAIGGDRREFPQTLWTVVLRAKDEGAPDRREALHKLIESYWKPVYFFIRRRGKDREVAKDLAQGFFATLLERNYLQYVERERGRFRTFLMTALAHFMADEHDRAQAKKRGGDRAIRSLDFEEAETGFGRSPGAEEPDRAFCREWAVRVMAQAMQAVRKEFEVAGRTEEFNLLRPHLAGGGTEPGEPYAEVARKLATSEGEARKRVHRLRARYREAMLDVIRSYAATEEDVQEEVRDLFGSFS